MAENVTEDEGEVRKPTDPSRVAPPFTPGHVARGQAWPRYSLGAGSPGPGVPDGGAPHTILTKRSAQGYDTEWRRMALPTVAAGIPLNLTIPGGIADTAPVPVAGWTLVRQNGDPGVAVVPTGLQLSTGKVYQIIEDDEIQSGNATHTGGGGNLRLLIGGVVWETISIFPNNLPANSRRRVQHQYIRIGQTQNELLTFTISNPAAIDHMLIHLAILVIELTEAP